MGQLVMGIFLIVMGCFCLKDPYKEYKANATKDAIMLIWLFFIYVPLGIWLITLSPLLDINKV